MQDHMSHNFMNKKSVCAKPGQKSTDQSFSKAANTCDSVITVKSHRSHISSCQALLSFETKTVGVEGQRNMGQKPITEQLGNTHATSGIPV